MKYWIALPLMTFLFCSLSSCSTLPNSKQAQTAHGSYTYYLSETTKPTVVLEAGLGDDMTTWQPLVTHIETISNVFTYNRAGFSGSKSHHAERNGAIIVKELRALLASVGATPPYILIGHSLGGGYMELYAKSFPEDVAGVILIDPNSSKYPQHCKAANLDYCDPPSSIPGWASLFLPNAVEGEIKGFAKTHSQINATNHFPNVPLVVLSASQTRDQQSIEVSKLYTQMHRDIASQSPISKFIVCKTCSHYIHHDNPQMIVDAIQWVINQQTNR